ncbi:MAG: tRNA (guanosine(18)-2'-O)-methyltransferase TrmH [Thermotogae bacterium]|nr:tRNA (guanosine(18)-2'-O)-methyltransferase TrmH [Thermotogota bacterium]
MSVVFLVSDRRLRRILEVLKRRQRDLRVFVENVKNEHNFSAILRTCDAVGVMYVHYYYEGESLPINREISRGSERWVALVREEDTLKALRRLKEEGYQVVATHLSAESRDFRDVDYTRPTVIVLGNEDSGVSDAVLDVADHNVIIPMYGMVQSLNVSVANALLLYEAQRQRLNAGMYDRQSLTPEEFDRFLRLWTHERIVAEGLRRAKGRT